jgi:hypothetical protein
MLSRIRSLRGWLAALVCLVVSGWASADGQVIFSGSQPKILGQQAFNNGLTVTVDQTSAIQALNSPSFIVLYGNGTFSWIPSGNNASFGNLFPVYGKVKALPSGWIQLTNNVDSFPPSAPAGAANLTVDLDGVILNVNGTWYAVLAFSKFTLAIERDANGNFVRTSTAFQTATFMMELTVE